MRAGRGSSGIPRSGSSNGFATSTAMPAGSPLLRTTCWRAGCGSGRSSYRCGTILAMRRRTLVRRWRRSPGWSARSTSLRSTCRTATPALCRPTRRRPPKRFVTGTMPRSASSAAPKSILCDKPKLAVARILGDGSRQRTRVSSELQSHYLFADRFGRPGKGNDKGKVEGLVGWIRRNLLVPVPRAASFTALNEQLLEGCRRRLGDRLRGHDETIGERLARDLAAFQDLPPALYDACEKKAARVSSQSLVRYRGTDYSVPTAYGHREVVIRGYVHEMVISCGATVIARHPCSYEREGFGFDPLHYLALLERKIGALDQPAPLVGWALPEEFATLRRLIEARMATRGKREFVQVLRLLEVFRREDVLAGVREAIARGVIGFDAVKHLVLCRIERRPPRLDLTVYPYLPRATVAITSARAYLDLLTGASA